MASAFGHAVLAITIGQSFSKKYLNWKFLTLGIICSILPDADVLSFKLGIPYEAFWGHRGFSHSLLFATIVGLTVVLIFYRKKLVSLQTAVGYFVFFSLCTASHSLLDAMTTGGLGVALFSPWDETRYFFPWRPIEVSPIGIGNFFSEWGKKVLLNELVWIVIPSSIYIGIIRLVKRIKTNYNKSCE
jgi:inner membrane protein